MSLTAVAVVPFATVGTWTALLMLLPAFYGEIDTDGGALWVWFVAHAALLGLCIRALLADRQVLREPPETPP